jgi:mono/diheme cytochrome c family protein
MPVRFLAFAGGLVLIAGLAVSPAFTQDATAPKATPEQLAAGKQHFIDAACHNCHGANGQGGGGVDFPAGPSLRKSQLDPESMAGIISCGMPNTRMPAWHVGAYSEFACYGAPLGPAPSGTLVTGIFTDQQIAELVAYIQTEFMKK